MAVAAAVERGSDHPLAQAILRRAVGLAIERPTGFEVLEGMGARAEVGGQLVLLGNRRLMDEQGVDLSPLAADIERLKGSGHTAVHVARGGVLVGLIAIADAPRPTSATAVHQLQQRASTWR